MNKVRKIFFNHRLVLTNGRRFVSTADTREQMASLLNVCTIAVRVSRRMSALPCSIHDHVFNTRGYTCRHHVTTAGKNTGQDSVVVYRWRTMRHFYFISRFKLYQVSAMIVLLGPLSYWYKGGVITLPPLLYGYGAALGTTVVLSVLSYGFSRVVGEITFSHTTSKVSISTLSFMGSRKRVFYSLEQIIPYADSQRRESSIVQRLETVDPHGVYYYSLKYGQVMDIELLKRVLGM